MNNMFGKFVCLVGAFPLLSANISLPLVNDANFLLGHSLKENSFHFSTDCIGSCGDKVSAAWLTLLAACVF